MARYGAGCNTTVDREVIEPHIQLLIRSTLKCLVGVGQFRFQGGRLNLVGKFSIIRAGLNVKKTSRFSPDEVLVE